jgi:hypothetical protein
MTTFDSIESLAIIFKDNELVLLRCKQVVYEQYHYIALYKCVILTKVRR